MEQISDRDAGQMNFSLPHDVVQLPSGGIFYKNKKKSVKVGYLTASDENILANAASNSNVREGIILNLVRNKMYETDIRPEELLEGDIEAILIFLRNTSFGPEYNIVVTDPDTGKPFSTQVVLDELNIKRSNARPDDNGFFETSLPRTGDKVKLKPLFYYDLIELDRMADSYPQGRVPPRITWRLNKHIIEVNGNQDRNFIASYIESLPIMDSKYIRKFISENEPRLDLSKSVITPSGKKVDTEVAFGVEFFRPFF